MQWVLSWRYFSLPSCVKRQPSQGELWCPNPSFHLREEHFSSPSDNISISFTRPERWSANHNHPQGPWRATQSEFAAEDRAHSSPPGLTPDQKQQESLNRKEASGKPGMRQHMRPRLWGQVRCLTSLTGERPSLPGGDRTQVTRWYGDRTQEALPILAGPCEALGGLGKQLSGLGLPKNLQIETLGTFVRRASSWSHLEGCSMAHSAGKHEQSLRYS